jgi:ribosome-associated toxin RatA of RatAB toxin-antitoxin module
MSTVQCSAAVAADPQRVFEVFTDLERGPERIRAIKKIELLTPAPLRVGSRFRETRTMFGKDATEEFEVVELQPSRLYAVACDSCGVRFGMRFEFVPQAGGTRIDMRVDTQPRTFFAKLMSPLSGLMMKSCVKAFEADMADLRKACEGR